MKRFICFAMCFMLIFAAMPTEVFAARPLKRTLTVNNGTGGGQYYAGDEVAITAIPPQDGMAFIKWDNLYGVEFVSGSIFTPEATFIMPSSSFAITAVFEKYYHLEVEGGTGTGDYLPGTDVAIKANEPEENREFKVWKGAGNISFSEGNYNDPEAVIKMPAQDVKLEASYKDVLDDDMPVEVLIDGVSLKSGYYLKSGETSISEEKPEGDSYVYYSRGVLTMHNYVSNGKEGPFIKIEKGNIVIDLEGKNLVNKSTIGNGINMTEGNVTIRGTKNDSLEFNLNEGYGIYFSYSGNLTLEGGKIKIKFDEDSVRSIAGGIRGAASNIYFSGSDVEIYSEDTGVMAWHKVKINSGNININVTEGRGIEVNDVGTVEITGGNTKINAKNTGIECESRITIRGGSIEAVSEKNSGISSADFVDILGGKIIGISKAEKGSGVLRAVVNSKMNVTVSKNSSGTPTEKFDGNSNNYKYFKAEEKVSIPGDCNSDGKVSMADLLVLRKHLAGINVNIDFDASNVNDDTKVSMADLLLLRKHLAGINVELK